MAHRLTAQAEADLDEIWSYIVKESGNIEIARRQIASLTDPDSSCFLITRSWAVRAMLI
jgi:plasmid stabilization system protein ParE